MRLHRLDSPDSLSRLLSTQYTNVFLFVCPDEYFDDDGNAVDDDFRGCNDFMERVFRVSGALGDNSVVSFRLGLAAASTTSDVARSFRLPPSPVVLYARKNQAGETHVAQFVGKCGSHGRRRSDIYFGKKKSAKSEPEIRKKNLKKCKEIATHPQPPPSF